eukprot:gene11773-11918_t
MQLPPVPSSTLGEQDLLQKQQADISSNALVWALQKVDDKLNQVEQQPSDVHRALYDFSNGPVGDALSNKGSYFDRVRGLDGVFKAAVTCGATSATGDLLAQFLSGQTAKSEGKRADKFDPVRTLRMFGFGFVFYGPYQYYWYNLLDHLMPIKNTPNFLSKVALNQLALAPVVLAAVFAWNLGLTNQLAALPGKIGNDLLPSMINGWKFWIPAASLNFYAVPVNYQVAFDAC